MSDTYFDLPSRLEDSFPEIDSDIVTDLRKNNEEYAEIQQQISELKKQFPCIMNVMEEKGEIHLTAEEHAAFVQCLRLQRKLDDMERLQLLLPWTYGRGGLSQENQSNLILAARNNPGRFSHLRYSLRAIVPVPRKLSRIIYKIRDQ